MLGADRLETWTAVGQDHSMIRIGVDLGGTKTEAIALGADGEELARRRVPLPIGLGASYVRLAV